MTFRRDATAYRMYFGYKRRRFWLFDLALRAFRRVIPSTSHQDANDR